jgi:hypothetical protein
MMALISSLDAEVQNGQTLKSKKILQNLTDKKIS